MGTETTTAEVMAPVVSLKETHSSPKKDATNLVVFLEGGSLANNLYIRLEVDGEYIIGRRINAGLRESHPITVPNGEERVLEILKPGKLPLAVRRRIKAPRKLPMYTTGGTAKITVP